MSDRYCSLVVLAPGAPRTFKIHLSRGAIAIAITAFLLSSLAVIWVAARVPHVDDFQRARLEAENRLLKAEASDVSLHLQKLSEKVLELEAKSEKINALANE